MEKLRVFIIFLFLTNIGFSQSSKETSGILQVTGLYAYSGKSDSYYDFINLEGGFKIKPRWYIGANMSYVSYRYGQASNTSIHFYAFGIGAKYALLNRDHLTSFGTFGVTYQAINYNGQTFFSNGVGPFGSLDLSYRFNNNLLLGVKSQAGVGFGKIVQPSLNDPNTLSKSFGILPMLTFGLSIGYLF